MKVKKTSGEMGDSRAHLKENSQLDSKEEGAGERDEGLKVQRNGDKDDGKGLVKLSSSEILSVSKGMSNNELSGSVKSKRGGP